MASPSPSVRELESRLDARVLRRIAGGLVAYGVVGLVLLVLLGVMGARSLGAIEPFGNSLEAQREQLATALQQTSAAIRDAATGTSNAGASLGQARDSARRAATLSRSVGTTMRSVAAASQISIFGSQPLGALGSGFSQAASQADELGANLDSISAALGTNGTDIARVRADLDALAAQTDALAKSVDAMPPFAGALQGVDALRLVLLLLGLWLAVPAVAALIGGAMLWRWLDAHEGPPVGRRARWWRSRRHGPRPKPAPDETAEGGGAGDVA